MTKYTADSRRYDNNTMYRYCGKNGLKLPAISLGLWHNFGGVDKLENMRDMLRCAFDNGITHFDLANNYGPPAGSAEENFGRLFKDDFVPYRDELIISSKAGYYMWEGPYGDRGSKKYLTASLDQSLRRMGLDYVDIFYSHREDPETPLEETMGALAGFVKQGKALYVGISSYSAENTKKAAALLSEMGVKLLIHQPSYSILNRWVEDSLLDTLDETGVGSIAFCPLEQGLLTNRYLQGIPDDSRAARSTGALQKSQITPELIEKLNKLNQIAEKRGQSLAQMSLSWILQGGRVTSALIGASRKEQILENLGALKNIDFTESELNEIDSLSKEV